MLQVIRAEKTDNSIICLISYFEYWSEEDGDSGENKHQNASHSLLSMFDNEKVQSVIFSQSKLSMRHLTR